MPKEEEKKGFNEKLEYDAEYQTIDAEGQILCDIYDDVDGRYANRIVECVNALKGVAEPEKAIEDMRFILMLILDDNKDLIEIRGVVKSTGWTMNLLERGK